MSTFTLNNENKQEHFVSLVKRFCEIGFFREDLRLLADICREDITFYSNLVPEIKHGIMSFEDLKLHDFVETIIACVINYELVNVSIDSDGGGQVTLKASLNTKDIFHIIATISEEKNGQGDSTFLLSRLHIFCEQGPDKITKEQKNTLMQSSKIMNGTLDIKEAFSRHGGTCGYAVLYWEETYPIHFADDRLLKHLGYENLEEFLLVGDGVEHLHPNDIGKKIDDLKLQQERGNDFAIELRLRKKDGSFVWVGAIGTFSFNDENREIITVTFIDIHDKQEEISSFFHLMQNFSGGFAVYEIESSNNLNTVYSSSSLCDFLKIGLSQAENSQGLIHNYNDSSFVEDMTVLHVFLRNALEKGEDSSCDFCVTLPGQSLRWLNASAKTYKNAYGNNLLYVVYLDITDQRRMSSKLDKFYKEIQAKVLVCKYDEVWSIHECGSSFYEELGYTEADAQNIFSNSFLAMTPADCKDELRQVVATQIENGNTFSTQISLQDKMGKFVYFLMTGELTLHADGKLLDFLLINISEVKKQEIMLNDATHEISHLYDNIPGAIIRCSPYLPCTLEFANNGFYNLIGYSKEEFEEVHQSSMVNLIHPEDVPHVQEVLSTCVNHGDCISLAYRIMPKNAKAIWLGIDGAFIINKNGEPSLYCTCNDITERYEMVHDLTLIKEKMSAVIRGTDLRYWDYFPNENKIRLIGESIRIGKEALNANYPESVIEAGLINQGSINEFRSLHARIKAGAPYAEAIILLALQKGEAEEWRRIRYTTIFDAKGKPSLAIGTSENITEYKEIERRLAVVAVQVGIEIWTYNLDSKVITQEANMATVGLGQKYCGNVPASVIESGAIHEDDIDKYLEIYRQLENGVSQISCDLRVKTLKTGEFRWTRLFYTILESENQHERLAIGSALDISELKLAEAHYENEIQLWSLGVENAMLHSVINLSTGRILEGNIDERLNITIGDLNAQDLLELINEHIAGAHGKEAYSRLFSIESLLREFHLGARTHTLELQIMLQSDESLWVSFSVTMMKNPLDGEIIGFLGMKDITEIKISQDFVKGFVTNQFDCIFRVHFNRNSYQLYSAGHVQELIKLIGFTGDFAGDINKLLTTIVVEEDLPTLLNEARVERFLERSAHETEYEIFFRTIRAEGETRFKRLRFFQRDDATQSICIGCIDVTEMHLQEQRRIETLRDALSAARHANESKSSFLASISHDIRTPMNAIIGMTNLAIEDQENATQVSESLSVIKSSSEHLLALLNDILEMSRLESGKIVFSREPFSITQECTQIYNVFKGIAIQKELKMNFECVNIEHDRVISDATRFNRVLNNLLGNAVKFTPNGGEIRLLVEEVGMQNETTTLFRITIQDSGIGIAKEHLNSIFEAFKREESSTVSKIEGTGLGLAIVKALVDGQGGVISVCSERGKGATFIVELPMIIDETSIGKDEPPTAQMQMKDVNLNSKHLLLVDDHPINILVASKMLTKMGAVISTATDGKDAYDKFYNSPEGTFKLIFMDLQMPVMNGHEATVAIRASDHPDAKTIPIVAMTANAFAEDVRNSKSSGMNCHIAKPITVESIVACLVNLKFI